VYVLTKEEGGRHTPFFPNYRPQFYFRTTDVTGAIMELQARDGGKAEMCMPGDNIQMRVRSSTRSPWRKACASPSAKAPHRRLGRRHEDPRVGARGTAAPGGGMWRRRPRR